MLSGLIEINGCKSDEGLRVTSYLMGNRLESVKLKFSVFSIVCDGTAPSMISSGVQST